MSEASNNVSESQEKKVIEKQGHVEDVKSDNIDEENIDDEVISKDVLKEEDASHEDDALQIALDEVNELKKSLDAAQSSLKEEQDKALRAVAEMENFKRRNNQALITAKTYALESFMKELLTVLDALDMACEHAESAKDSKTLLEGVELTRKQFVSILEKSGVSVIETKDKLFDPNFHQAVGKEDADDKKSDVIIREMQKGYQLHERVIRPSMVVIAN